MYAMGVGEGADRKELEEIASSKEYVFVAPSFKEMQPISPRIRKLLCKGNHWLFVKNLFVENARFTDHQIEAGNAFDNNLFLI